MEKIQKWQRNKDHRHAMRGCMRQDNFITECLAACGLFSFMAVAVWLLLAIFDGGYMFPGGF